MHETYAGPQFSVVGITDEDALLVDEFRRDLALTFPILTSGQAAREAYGIDFIWGSVYFLVDPEGRIVADTLDDAIEVLEASLAP